VDIPKNLLDDLESLLNSSSAKDVPHNGAEGVEGIYWEGTEAGLIGIPLFPGLIYAIDGSHEKGNMGASTGTKAKREASAKWTETKKAHCRTSGTCSGMHRPRRRDKLRRESEATDPAHGLQMPFDGNPETDWRRNRSDHQGISRWRHPTGNP